MIRAVPACIPLAAISVCAAFGPLEALGQAASDATPPKSERPLTSTEFVTSIIKRHEAAIKEVVAPFLNRQYPIVAARGGDSIASREQQTYWCNLINTDEATKGSCERPADNRFKIDWRRAPYTVAPVPGRISYATREFRTPEFRGWVSRMDVKQRSERRFNCDPKVEREVGLAITDETEQQIKRALTEEIEKSIEERLKVTVTAGLSGTATGPSGNATAKIESVAENEFKRTARHLVVRYDETTLRQLARQVSDFRIKLAPLTSDVRSIAVTRGTKRYHLVAEAIYDTELTARLPVINDATWPLPIGDAEPVKLSTILERALGKKRGVESRTYLLEAEADVSSFENVRIVDGDPTPYLTQAACRAAQNEEEEARRARAGAASASTVVPLDLRPPMSAADMVRFTRPVSATYIDCKAEAAGHARLADPERANVELAVRLSSCPAGSVKSTGRIDYKLRVRDSEGRSETLGPFEARWTSITGQRFTIADRAALTKGRVAKIDEVVEERSVNCSCWKD